MKLVECVMKWLGVREASRDEIINAQIEDNARDLENVVGALHVAFTKRHERNKKLRDAISTARRASSLVEFEQEIQRGRHVRRSD